MKFDWLKYAGMQLI